MGHSFAAGSLRVMKLLTSDNDQNVALFAVGWHIYKQTVAFELSRRERVFFGCQKTINIGTP